MEKVLFNMVSTAIKAHKYSAMLLMVGNVRNDFFQQGQILFRGK